jgi:serine/threonine-protein kinase
MSGPEPGLEILPGLTLLRRLGRGGMGEAWLARDASSGAEVVAKLLPADAPPERLALLRREARLVRKLSHPGIVPVIGFRAGERFCAVTLEYMPGGDAQVLRGAAPAEVARLGRELADALAYLHDMGVVHRDVKASNVLLDAHGRARLADFGIASVAQEDEDGLVVRGGGSRASMSPQQRSGAAPTPADDLYALGVLLFELLAGKPPAEGDAAASMPVLWTLPMPERLRGLVASLVAGSVEARPRSAAAARDELDAIVKEVSGSAPIAQRQAVRLQPPPRVVERQADAPELFAARPERSSPVSPQLVFLGALVVMAIGAVVWLPRLAERPGNPTVPVSPVPATMATPEPSVPPSAEATPEPEIARPPAEEPDPPAEPARAAVPAARSPQPPADPAVPEGEPAPAPVPTPDRDAEAQALASHREQGLALEAREDWKGALQHYTAALAIDPHVTFALEGRERAAKRAALYDAIDAHLKRPERLSAVAVGREAEALLERARVLSPGGTALESRIASLEAALAAARQPVAVVIESDGLTELTLSRVGPIGALKRRSLELVPGSYTVTGSRRGYRDVRRQFSVAPGAPGPVVSLRCDEAL